jgi:toxin ParE1/3/4
VLKLVWRARALSDLETILSYIADRNVEAADGLLAVIEAYTERLPEHPFLYRTGRVDGTRKAVVHPNYIVIYRVGKDEVEIVNIVHARQQYP